jgi:hypothetical protein
LLKKSQKYLSGKKPVGCKVRWELEIEANTTAILDHTLHEPMKGCPNHSKASWYRSHQRSVSSLSRTLFNKAVGAKQGRIKEQNIVKCSFRSEEGKKIQSTGK